MWTDIPLTAAINKLWEASNWSKRLEDDESDDPRSGADGASGDEGAGEARAVAGARARSYGAAVVLATLYTMPHDV